MRKTLCRIVCHTSTLAGENVTCMSAQRKCDRYGLSLGGGGGGGVGGGELGWGGGGGIRVVMETLCF